MGGVWVDLAWLLAAYNLFLVIWGVTQPDIAALLGGYSFSGAPLWIGLGVLVVSVLLFFYRRAVQDKAKITFRDTDVSVMPNAEQMELLREEAIPS